MKVAVVYNRDLSGVINVAHVQNKETYDPSTVEAVAAALERGGHNVRLIDGNMHIIERLREFMPRVVAGDRPGMVFNMAYGIQGVSRYTHLPAMLEMLGVPYVGSNPQAHALALDKVIAKVLFQTQGISTPKFWNFATPDDVHPDLTYPVIVKPKMEGMSLGITRANNHKELRAAVSKIIRQFKQHVLVEQLIAGREFTVGLLGNADVEALPVVELDLGGNPSKIRADEGNQPLRKICPAPLSKAQTARLQDLARRSFQALGLHDYGRIDVRMDQAGTPYVLEINSMADLGRDGAYVFSAKHAGYDFDALINRVLNVAAARYFGADPGQGRTSADKKGPKARSASVVGGLPAVIRNYARGQVTTMGDSLRGLADLQSPAAIRERVESQLALIGLTRRTKARDADGPYAFFSNYTGSAPGIVLVADLASPESRALRVSEDGSRVYGQVQDVGGVVVALSALRALRFARVLDGLRCGLALVWGDSAASTEHRQFSDALTRASAVLGTGPSALDGSLVESRTGETEYLLASRFARSLTRLSTNTAVVDFLDRLKALEAIADPDESRDVSFSRFEAARTGPFSLRLEAGVSVRYPTQRDGATAEARVFKIAGKRSVAGVTYDVTVTKKLSPLAASRASRALLDRLKGVVKEAQVQVGTPRQAGPSRLGALAQGRPCIDGFGPATSQTEAGEPFLLRNSLQDRSVLLALAIHRLSATKTK